MDAYMCILSTFRDEMSKSILFDMTYGAGRRMDTTFEMDRQINALAEEKANEYRISASYNNSRNLRGARTEKARCLRRYQREWPENVLEHGGVPLRA